MMTTAAKMAFRRKDLGWRGSGDAIVIVGFCLVLFFVCQVKERSEEMREESYYFDRESLLDGISARESFGSVFFSPVDVDSEF
jgi:Na+/melibiose symporter-like transporter